MRHSDEIKTARQLTLTLGSQFNSNQFSKSVNDGCGVSRGGVVSGIGMPYNQ